MARQLPDINFYSRAYDNFLEPEICDEFVKLYEQTLTEEMDRVKELDLCYEKDGTKICNQCTCMRMNIMKHDRFRDLNKLMIGRKKMLIYILSNGLKDMVGKNLR